MLDPKLVQASILAAIPPVGAALVFDLDPGSESLSELRVQLKAADQPVSETWLYRWTA